MLQPDEALCYVSCGGPPLQPFVKRIARLFRWRCGWAGRGNSWTAKNTALVHAGVQLELGHKLEFVGVVADEREVQRQGIGSNPQVVVANGCASTFQVRLDGAVAFGYCTVGLDHRDQPTQMIKR